MIDEAIGKILGMAMAYLVSALGLFLAYVNYRKRIVRAERVMSSTAWVVVVVILAAVAGGVLVVSQLAQQSAAVEAAAPAVAAAAPAPAAAPTEAALRAAATAHADNARWPLTGMVVPVVIFLFATWVTAALYNHFSRSGH
jgi:hypothetical protein